MVPNRETGDDGSFQSISTKDRLAMSGDLLRSRIISEIRYERQRTSAACSKLSAENELLF